ncbi:MAG: ABC transporter ATP-binding protein [Candidatus Hodarchaeales archaeon]
MTETVSETILQVSNLTKIYGREIRIGNRIQFGQHVRGAHEVSFHIRKGEIFGFLGPNGAGKTTSMRAILDYLKLGKGKIEIFGFDHRKDRVEIRKRIGYVPGDMALFENFTGEELISYFGKFRPIDQEFLQELRSLFRVKLHKKIKSLSKGNRQQVGLIAVMASKPSLLILDEPTSGLDPLMTANFHTILKKLQKEGVTIFLSSHDLTEVQAICDRVGIIRNGEMILVEAVTELKSKFLQNMMIQFTGENIPTEEDFKQLDTVISVECIKPRTYKLKIGKDVTQVLKFLSRYELKRFTCEDADLEEIFLQYYR